MSKIKMSEAWKLEKGLCRCCHAEGSFTSLAESSHDSPQDEIVSEMLRRCFDIDIRPVEGTYNKSTYTICEPCILQLRDASNFKQQVLRCEERFRDMYRSVTAPSPGMKVEPEVEEEEENIIEFEIKEECFEIIENDAGAGDDAHDDTPLPKQPSLDTNLDETDQFKPQKEKEGHEEITSSVELNKNTATDVRTREVNDKGTNSENDNSQSVFVCNDCGKLIDSKRISALQSESHEKLKQGKDLKCSECAYQTETQELLERHEKSHDKKCCFICDICGYTAKKKFRLLNHIKLKNDHLNTLQSSNIFVYKTNDIIKLKEDLENVCNVCGYKFPFRSVFAKHLRIHVDDKPHSCSLCGQKYAQKNYLTRHLQTHTGEKPHSCSFCGYKFVRNSDLNKHLRRKHTGEKPYTCSFCEYKCVDTSSLKRHLRKHTKGENKYSCSLCEFKTGAKTDLTKHLEFHTSEKLYSCSYCSYKCTHLSRYTSHLLTHTGEKQYSCTFCDYKSTRKANLKNHMLSHSGEKPFSCSFCGYKFARNSDLNKHILRKHKVEKPFNCSFCEYKCVDKSSLKRHLRTHTKGENKYSCSLCEFKTAAKTDLTKHLQIHTSEKLYSCSYCSYKCTHLSRYTSHLRIHTGEKPYSCTFSFCDYKSTQKANLKNHLRTHSGEKPYSCTFCDYKCVYKSSLKVHLKRHSVEKP